MSPLAPGQLASIEEYDHGPNLTGGRVLVEDDRLERIGR
jgi:hypothetical protein